MNRKLTRLIALGLAVLMLFGILGTLLTALA